MGRRAVEHRQKYPAAPVDHATFGILQHTWTRLVKEGERLLNWPVPLNARHGNVLSLVDKLHKVIAAGLESAAQVRCLIPPCSPKSELQCPNLKIGVGNPGKTGCVSVDGSSVIWSKLLGRPWSAITAMDKLGLHILGLPAARLRSGIALAGCPGWNLECRGGPSYFSCAVIWKQHGPFQFEPISEVGSDCRIWLSISRSGLALGYCAFIAMPTQASTEHDTRWLLEMEGLDSDMLKLASSWDSPNPPHFFIAGDFNVQPAVLSGQADPKPRRDLALRSFLNKWSVSLLNPSVAGARPRLIRLPVRKTEVSIREGDTHHAGNPRAIDLVLCSRHTRAEVIVHNSLHCASSGCSWEVCADFCMSDHFLIEITVSASGDVEDVSSAQPQLPRQWHMPRRWASSLIRIAPAVRELCSLVRSARDCLELESRDCRRVSGLAFRRWVLDCFCWVHCFFASVARDGWVHPTCSPAVPCHTSSRVHMSSHTDDSARIVGEVQSLLAGGNLPVTVAQKCFKFLRKNKVPTPVCMRKNGVLLSPLETHKEWCNRLTSQCSGPVIPDASVLASMRQSVSSMMGRAWKKCGQGPLDRDISEPEVRAVLSSWQSSAAISPDLIPRAALQADQEDWICLVWLLCQLAGPARWALRPSLWRWSCLGTAFKKGSVSEFSSWRLLFVRSQMGLLQEGVLALQLRPAIWSHLLEGQSGYIRSSDDPVFALSELRQLAVASQNRCVFALMGDFQKAFPSCWRDDIIHLAAKCPLVSGGVLHLLGDALASDLVSVFFGGFSVLPVLEGLPEGGCLGPILYPLIPDSLSQIMAREKCGVAIRPDLPANWESHRWSGQGVPQPHLVASLLHDLNTRRHVPDSSELQADPDLEASAARAIDLRDQNRLCLLLHADDPVFLASSWGELCRMVLMIERWAPAHGARFHISDNKTLVFRLGGFGQMQHIFFRPSPSATCASLSRGSGPHRWLGWMWTEDGGALETLQARLHAASGVFSTLAGLCSSNVVPLPFVLKLFEGKVDACMRPGRWLFAVLATDAAQILDDAYARWARILLGVPSWMPAHAVFWELGWSLSGMARAVLDVAMRRARMQCWDSDDLFRRIFDAASHSATDDTWSSKSLRLLREWGIRDFCEGNMHLGIREYKRYVKHVLEARCLEKQQSCIQSSTCFLSWRVIYPKLAPHDLLASILKQPMSWSSLLASRALCRLRLNLFPLGHRQGSFSKARVVKCIACDKSVQGPLAHVLLSCERFAEARGALASCECPAEGSVSGILCLQPGQEGFEELLALAREVQDYVFAYWRERSRPLRMLLP